MSHRCALIARSVDLPMCRLHARRAPSGESINVGPRNCKNCTAPVCFGARNAGTHTEHAFRWKGSNFGAPERFFAFYGAFRCVSSNFHQCVLHLNGRSHRSSELKCTGPCPLSSTDEMRSVVASRVSGHVFCVIWTDTHLTDRSAVFVLLCREHQPVRASLHELTDTGHLNVSTKLSL